MGKAFQIIEPIFRFVFIAGKLGEAKINSQVLIKKIIHFSIQHETIHLKIVKRIPAEFQNIIHERS